MQRHFLFVALACASCAPKLPPTEELQLGCHVWWDNGEGRGAYASVSGGDAVLTGSSDVYGFSMSESGTISINGKSFGEFDGKELFIDQMTMATTSYSGPVGKKPVYDVTLVSSGDGSPWSFSVSDACEPEEAALGAATVFLALFEGARAARANALRGSH